MTANNNLSYLPTNDVNVIKAFSKKIAEKILLNLPTFINSESLPDEVEEPEEDARKFKERKKKYFETKEKNMEKDEDEDEDDLIDDDEVYEEENA